jgi:hypothetical protein
MIKAEKNEAMALHFSLHMWNCNELANGITHPKAIARLCVKNLEERKARKANIAASKVVSFSNVATSSSGGATIMQQTRTYVMMYSQCKLIAHLENLGEGEIGTNTQVERERETGLYWSHNCALFNTILDSIRIARDLGISIDDMKH